MLYYSQPNHGSFRLCTFDSTETVIPVGEDSFFVQDHPERTLQRMEAFLLHQRLCDVVLVVGSERIPAHRLVLSAVSDYFAAMFTSEVREARQNEVRMEAVDPAALWALVHYAYTGRLELHEETVEELLSAACLLQLQPAVQVCCAFLLRQLHPANCLGVRAFADSLGCTRLLAAAHSYTMDHFTEVIGHQEFMLLPPSEVEQLLSSDDINVPDEETIFNALMAWTRHDLEARRRVLARLLAHVRLPLLSPQVLPKAHHECLTLHKC
uniref:Kelch-like family member 4 n=1 Tax=Eptatretus burgeri TaxID=7764 RepID=A0A8C4QNS8_EPTBU